MPDTDAILQALVGGGLVVAVAKLAEVWWRRRVPVAEARKIDAESEVALSDAATRAAESIRSTLTAELDAMRDRHQRDLDAMTARHTAVLVDMQNRLDALERASASKDRRIAELERENGELTTRVAELEARLAADERRLP